MKYFWHTTPFLRLAAPFALGIFIGLKCAGEFRVSPIAFTLASAFGICTLALLGRIWRKLDRTHIFGILVTVLFLFLGFTRIHVKEASPRWTIPEGPTYFARVNSVPEMKTRSLAVQLKIEAWQDSLNRPHPHAIKILAYIEADSVAKNLLPGDEIVFRADIRKMSPPLNPNQFNYAQYLKHHGITGTTYLSRTDYRRTGHTSDSFGYLIQRWRRMLIDQWISYGFDARENAVIAALVLGDRTHLEDGLRDKFAGAGAVHILAVSGLHVGIIYLFAVSVLGFALRHPRWKWIKFLSVLLLLWFYAAITGFSPSVLRAATMFSFIAIGKFHGRYLSVYNMVFASAIFLLAINPFLLAHVGFQLSYLAVLGIIYLHPKIYGLFHTSNWLLDKAWSLLAVSLAAQVATFPLSIHYFQQFPSYFFLTNLLVIPLAWLILHAGILWLITFSIPWVGDLFAHLAHWTAFVLNEVVIRITDLPGAVLQNVYFTGYTGLLIYLLIIAAAAASIRPTPVRLRVMYATVLCLVGVYAYRSVQRDTQAAYFFPADAKQPTAVLIEGRHATAFVTEIDTASKSSTAYLIEGYLHARGVKKITWTRAFSCPDPADCTAHSVHLVSTQQLGSAPAPGDAMWYLAAPAAPLPAAKHSPPSIIVADDTFTPAVHDPRRSAVHALHHQGALAVSY